MKELELKTTAKLKGLSPQTAIGGASNIPGYLVQNQG